MADDITREASIVCIYWETSAQNPALDEAGVPGKCTASSYFSKSIISCYNDGNCDGAGTCRNCSAYNVGGLQFSQKNTSVVYGTTHLLQWNSELETYVQVRPLSSSETSPEYAFTSDIPLEYKLSSVNVNAEQVPMNLAIYNLRAKFKKCCNWQASPFLFYKSRDGTLYAQSFGSTTVQNVSYLVKTQGGVYVNAEALSTPCKVTAASPWKTPFTDENPTAYGCNGCKPECPYYTGPEWQYCVDSKMGMGDSIKAEQILELRYFSTDWAQYSSPETEYRKRFKDPFIYAWNNEFEFGGSEADSFDDNPIIKAVCIAGFTSPEPIIIKGSPRPVDAGVQVDSEDYLLSTQTYPTLIKEIGDLASPIKITWPNNTNQNSPFVFRTFRIGQNTIRIYVETPYVATVYAVNLTKHPQDMSTDSSFLENMRKNNPDGLYTFDGTDTSQSLLYFDVELEFNPALNKIKVFSRDPTSSTGEYLTDVCYVEHKFYHAMIAQTRGDDHAGHARTEPWVDRFEHVSCQAEVLLLSNAPQVDKVLWDSDAGGKLSMYPIEEIHEEVITNWVPIGCNLAAVTFGNLKCHNVMGWSSFGSSPRGESLYMRLDRSRNTSASSDGTIELKLVMQSLSGGLLPGNVVIVAPADGQPWSAAFNKSSDVVKARYYTTDYKQAPVVAGDQIKLQYPNYSNVYMDQMPIEMNFDGSKLEAEGSSVAIITYGEGGSETRRRVYDLVDIKEELYNRLLDEETTSIDSFHQGGTADKNIKSSAEVFQQLSAKFESDYAMSFFESDGSQVTLYEMCKRLGLLKFHEGDYTFVFIFNDETGRPIGSKRISMMFQAAKPETRDVEIKYAWTMKLLAWPIIDSLLLLARYNEPPAPATSFEGPETYYPKCGDHAEEFLRTHEFGDPGPMWYPYISCLSPRYHETDFNMAVKCKNYVEGFGAGNNNTGSLDGKRWDYWERMRGPDMLSTHIAGTVFLVGCFYREVSYSYQLTDMQKFTGYTRIRSGHPHAQFAKDREALRVSRHFIKRNLKVRNEIVTDVNSGAKIGWTDEFKQLIFTDPNDPSKGILVGDEQETPIWVHLSDGVSEVNRTTDSVQHPFAHYLLQSVGNYSFSETFDTERYKLSQVLMDRDLTSIDARKEDGSLVFVPGDPVYMDDVQNYNDIVPVFTKDNTAWAWLERPKDPVREDGNIIGGLKLYNPSLNVWKTDRESASFSNEGPNSLVYTSPTFDEESGALMSLPSFQWAGGPIRYFDWFTGVWAEIAVPTYNSPYSKWKSSANFDFFGKGSDGYAFLADSTGKHTYVSSTTNSGTTFRETVRGLGVDSTVQTDILPYTRSDLVTKNQYVSNDASRISEHFSNTSGFSFEADFKGHYYVESIDITWRYGTGTALSELDGLINVRYDIPSLNIYVKPRSIGGSFTGISLVASTTYDRATEGTVDTSVEDGEGTYVFGGAGYKYVSYSVQTWAGAIKISFGSLFSGDRAYIEDIKIWYREPKAQTEQVMNYEQKVNISTGNTGSPDYRKMLYYYSRTLVDYNVGTAYSQLEGDFFSSGQVSPNLKSVKFTNRTVKDTILEYEFADPTGTRFPYNSKTHPQENPLSDEDDDGYWHIPDALSICTKSRTLIGRSHVEDNPQYVLNGSTTVTNKKNLATNENTVLCGYGVGDDVLGEQVQECLYSEAESMLGGDVTTVYNWFWHPDERDFWENTVGIHLPGETLTLTLTSAIPEMYRLYQHEHFGCTSDMSTPLSDGHLHSIPPWQALGHRLYVGNPLFNSACYDVVVFKIQDHIGERTYGTSAYGSHAASGGTLWPYETYRDRDHYLNAGLIERGGYIGGSIGGVGPMFWAAQTQLSHGFTAVQQDTERETYESVYGGRNASVRADASSSHSHTDEHIVGSGEQEFVT